MKKPLLAHIPGKIAIILSLLSVLVLSGCSTTAKANTLHFLHIISDEEYQAYINLINNGQLNADGSYIATEIKSGPEVLSLEGSVHVTFAENAYIKVQYYTDAGRTEPVDLRHCYLMPGDYIYAAEPVCDHPSSNWYRFDRFRMYAYDENGNRTQELSCNSADIASFALRIPEDYAGTEISVVPMGKYEDRILELTDYYVDSTGHHQELSGKWIVNDQDVAAARVEVSPVEPLMIDFQYDADRYDFVSSNPSSFYHEKGLVRFETTFANSDIEQYSVELRELVGNFRFDPNLYPAEHGTVTFSYNGLSVNDVTHIDDGGSIHYTATPDTGYCATNSEGEISVDASNPDKTDSAIRAAIEFYPDEDVTVHLPQPEIGGTIEYYVDGKLLSGEKCMLRCGTVITMKFDNWNGWIVDANAQKEYTVTAAKDQAVSLGNSDLSKLFWESKEYMPTLSIIVKDSMKSATFAVLASENDKNNLSYNTGSKNSIIPDLLGQNDREIFGNEKVGTGRDIVLSVTDDTIVSGDAMKLEIVKKEKEGNESKFIQYITDLPVETPIGLYGESSPAASTTTYESVVLIVSKVAVSTYNTKSANHAVVTIRLDGGNDSHMLQDGEVLESSRNVEVTIIPENGYYITGSKLNNGVYSETMKYSKWEKEYQKILDKHSAQKLWYVTLNTADSYGNCVYKLDGVTVSGRTGIRKGQKLTLEYTLTDSNYQISRAAWALWESTETKTVTIPIDESLDGGTIQRSDYIEIERKKG